MCVGLRYITLLAILSLCASAVASQKQYGVVFRGQKPPDGKRARAIVVPFSGGHDQVTYDPTRVSEKELRRWVQLSPEVSWSNGYQFPPGTLTCGYKDKACNDPPHFASHVKANLQRIRHTMGLLNETSYPNELKEVVRYLRTVQQFFLWQQNQILKFVQTGSITYLYETYEDTDPGRSCSEILGQIHKSPTLVAALKIADSDWSNCAWDVEQARMGEYPLKDWWAFLRKYGIHETLTWQIWDGVTDDWDEGSYQ